MRGKRTVFVIMGLITCLLGTAGMGHSMIGPDQSMDDFPPWMWPYICPASIYAKVVTSEDVEYTKAANDLRESAMVIVKHFTAGRYCFEEMLSMMDTQFEIQLATIRLAKTKVTGLAMGKLTAMDDHDDCGTPPRRRPWPWPPDPDLLDLVKLQIDVFKTEMSAQYNLTDDELELLDASLDAHYKDFYMLLK